MRSKLGAAGAIFYLLVFACAYAYPYFDRRTFSGLPAVMLALPWIDYLPSGLYLAAVALNALIIYFVLAGLSWLLSTLWRSRA
jgi:hypothetical protein